MSTATAAEALRRALAEKVTDEQAEVMLDEVLAS